MDDFLFLVIVLAVPAAIIGSVVRMFLVARAVVASATSGLDRALPDLERALRQLPSQAGGSQRVQHAQIAARLAQVQSQMRQLDALRQQQYEARVGDLMGMAANAGISWTPPS